MTLVVFVFERHPSRFVIRSSLLCVGKNVIGFHDLLELDRGLLVVRISVRMVSKDQFSIGAFDLVRTCLPLNPQKRVIVMPVIQRSIL